MSINHDSNVFMHPITIKRRRGQKNIRLRITRQKEVILSAPYETSDREIQNTIKLKMQWIQRHLQKLDDDYDRFDPLKGILYKGQLYSIDAVPGNTIRGKVNIGLDSITVIYNKDNPPDRDGFLLIIEKWLKKQAKEEILDRTRSLSTKLRIKTQRIYVRNQKTRWGSSSSKGNLSFNWRIIMIPTPIQDYLIIHELCHQRQMNHSKTYWKEVETYYPEYRKAEKWLKEHRNLIGLFR